MIAGTKQAKRLGDRGPELDIEHRHMQTIQASHLLRILIFLHKRSGDRSGYID